MRKILGSLFIVAAMALGTAVPLRNANADPTLGVTIGGMGGLALPSADGTSSRFGWGFEGDYKLTDSFTAGLYYITSSQSITVPINAGASVSTDNAIHLYGVQGAYHFYIPGFALGLRAGIGNTSSSSGSISNSNTQFALGPYASYDWHFASMWSFGGDASIIFVTGSGSYNEVNLLATLKVWF